MKLLGFQCTRSNNDCIFCVHHILAGGKKELNMKSDIYRLKKPHDSVLYNILTDVPLPNFIRIISSKKTSRTWHARERGEMHAKFWLEKPAETSGRNSEGVDWINLTQDRNK